MPPTLAAARAGISTETLAAWKRDDGEFGALVEQAHMGSVCRKIGRIDEAGERGDWKADSWYLERNRSTRDDFGGAAGAGATKIEVIVNVQRATTLAQPEPPVVDITPEEEQ